MKGLFTLLLLLCGIFPVSAQWQFGNSPNQPNIGKRGLERVGDELWMGTYGSWGLYRSLDGLSWMQADFFPTNTDIYDIYADSPTSVLILTCERNNNGNMTVYHLVKPGKSWQIQARYVLPVNCCSNIARVLRIGERIVTFNESWGSLIAVNPDSTLAFNFSTIKFAYNAGTLVRAYGIGNGQYKVALSTDGGDSWTDAYQTVQVPRAVFVDPDYVWVALNNQKIVRKNRSTGLVQQVTPPFSLGDIYLRFGSLGDTLTLATNFEWWYSTDDGLQWQMLCEYANQPVQAFDVIEELPEWPTIYGQGNDMIRSDDEGASWQVINGGIGAYSILKMERNGLNSAIFAGTDRPDHPLYRSSNNGQSWTALNTPFTGSQFNDMAWMGASSLFVLESNDLYFTPDLGATWAQLSESSAFAGKKLDGFSWKVYAQGATAIRRYHVDGTFEAEFSPSPASPANPIRDFSPGPGEWYLLLQSGDFYFSTDEGASWTWRSQPFYGQNPVALTRSGANLIYWGGQRVLYSPDKGMHWLPADFPGYSGSLLGDVEGTAGIGAFACIRSLGVFASADDGASWFAFNDGLANPEIYTLVLNNTQLYAGSRRGGQWNRNATLPYLRGVVYHDLNQDNFFDNNEPPVPNATIRAFPSGRVATTDAAGRFVMPFAPGENDTLRLAALPAPGVSVSPPYLLDLGPAYSYRIGIRDWPAADLRVQAGLLKTLRAGEENRLVIRCRNAGAGPVTAVTATCILPPGVNWTNATPLPDAVSGNTLTWTFGELAPAANQNITVDLSTEPWLAAGALLTFRSGIQAAAPDANPADNEDILYASIQDAGGTDPVKEVDRAILTPTAIAEKTPLEFTFRFQNTGVQTKHLLVIEDELDPALDPATVQLLGSSHTCFWKISDGRVLTLTFPDLELPGAAIDETGSRGFARFSAQARPEVPYGTHIFNQATLSFNFELPWPSNTTDTQVKWYDENDPTLNSGTALGLRPNPAVYDLTADWNFVAAEPGRVRLIDVTGVAQLDEPIAPGETFRELNVTYVPAGVYVVFVEIGGQRLAKTVVVQHPFDPRRD